jgi:hypothetical protein
VEVERQSGSLAFVPLGWLRDVRCRLKPWLEGVRYAGKPEGVAKPGWGGKDPGGPSVICGGPALNCGRLPYRLGGETFNIFKNVLFLPSSERSLMRAARARARRRGAGARPRARRGVVHRDVKPGTCCSPRGRPCWRTSGSPRPWTRRAPPRRGPRSRSSARRWAPPRTWPRAGHGRGRGPARGRVRVGRDRLRAPRGAHPFAGRRSAQALMAAHVVEAPAPLTLARPDVPAPLAALVMRCLAKEPAPGRPTGRRSPTSSRRRPPPGS